MYSCFHVNKLYSITFLLWFLATPILLFCQDHENKTALIIGNTNYEVGALKNPVNDAKDLAETLSKVGFDVIVAYDLTNEGMKEAVREFGKKIKENPGIALFYYSGHGLQKSGTNYLVPIDADMEASYEIEDECMESDRVLRMLGFMKNPLNIIILDACRNNPFPSDYRSLSGGGLAQPASAPTGSIIAFSTAPGRVASDGEGKNGLYTQELIKAIRTPGLSIEQVFKATRRKVATISQEKQIPWENSSLLGDFYFIKSPEETKPEEAAGYQNIVFKNQIPFNFATSVNEITGYGLLSSEKDEVKNEILSHFASSNVRVNILIDNMLDESISIESYLDRLATLKDIEVKVISQELDQNEKIKSIFIESE
jgi:hypothetical protein